MIQAFFTFNRVLDPSDAYHNLSKFYHVNYASLIHKITLPVEKRVFYIGISVGK
jgi:hypothetical protein